MHHDVNNHMYVKTNKKCGGKYLMYILPLLTITALKKI